MSFSQNDKKESTDRLAIVNSILLQVIEAHNQNALQFIITNETFKIVPYDRAILFEIKKNKIIPINISGQATLDTLTEFHRKLNELISYLEKPHVIQELSANKFTNKQEFWAEYQRQQASNVLWLPIHSQGQIVLGLWIEKWDASPEYHVSDETKNLLSKYLLPAYGHAWEKYSIKRKVKPLLANKTKILVPSLLTLALLLYFIKIPLRIVAPCEVEPKDPTVITAPLQGVIQKISIKPGEHVDEGTVLFKYDDRLFSQELKIAKNEYHVAESSLNRALALGLHDQASLNEVAILKLKMQKQKIELELAQDNFEKVNVTSPTSGSVIINDIDQWAGKPVQIGEKIMEIADLSQTKLKIWIPENDNIQFNYDIPVQVVLNVSPEIKREANLSYIGNEIVVNEQQVPSFIAEANWKSVKGDERPGLKGTAVIYGEKVSLFYFLIRKPWITISRLLGPHKKGT